MTEPRLVLVHEEVAVAVAQCGGDRRVVGQHPRRHQQQVIEVHRVPRPHTRRLFTSASLLADGVPVYPCTLAASYPVAGHSSPVQLH